MVTTQPLRQVVGRRTRGEWRTIHVAVTHTEVGGVTTTTTPLYFSWNTMALSPSSHLPTSECLLKGALRDASTILVPTAHSRGICRAPPSRLLIPPRLEALRSFRGQPVYHGGGWLPANLGPHTYVATPSIYFPAGDRWVIRRLSGKELLEAYGVTSGDVSTLISYGFSGWSELVPIESLVTGFKAFAGISYFQDADSLNGGGRVFLAPDHQRNDGDWWP